MGSVSVAYTDDYSHVEKEFSSSSFQQSLFSIATINCIPKLHTLNSTEFTIHRNIERDLKNFQMIPLSAKNSVVKSKEALLDSISDFSLQMRHAMYRKKFKGRSLTFQCSFSLPKILRDSRLWGSRRALQKQLK